MIQYAMCTYKGEKTVVIIYILKEKQPYDYTDNIVEKLNYVLLKVISEESLAPIAFLHRTIARYFRNG